MKFSVQYVFNLGMETNYQFHDVFGLDPDLLGMVPQPCVALLLLFPINEKVLPQIVLVLLLSGFVKIIRSNSLRRSKSSGLRRMVRQYPALYTSLSKLLGMPVAL